MENADKPINPSTSIKINDTEFLEYTLPNKERQYPKLTKREYFSVLAMQGLMSSFTENAENGFYGTKEVVSTAIEYADELVKQLEKE